MPRPRKPTAVLRLTGATEKHPERLAARAAEPVVSDPLGPPPGDLRPDQRVAWGEIERLAPWLRSADRLAVEVAACLLATFRVMRSDMPSPLFARLETLLGRLGLTPADRSKVSAQPPGGSKNPFVERGRR